MVSRELPRIPSTRSILEKSSLLTIRSVDVAASLEAPSLLDCQGSVVIGQRSLAGKRIKPLQYAWARSSLARVYVRQTDMTP